MHLSSHASIIAFIGIVVQYLSSFICEIIFIFKFYPMKFFFLRYVRNMSIVFSSFTVMKSTDADFEPVLTSNISDNLNLTEVEEDDLTLSGYVEDSFEFLDHMDCSVLDHMDCSVPYQVCNL